MKRFSIQPSPPKIMLAGIALLVISAILSSRPTVGLLVIPFGLIALAIVSQRWLVVGADGFRTTGIGGVGTKFTHWRQVRDIKLSRGLVAVRSNRRFLRLRATRATRIAEEMWRQRSQFLECSPAEIPAELSDPVVDRPAYRTTKLPRDVLVCVATDPHAPSLVRARAAALLQTDELAEQLLEDNADPELAQLLEQHMN